MGQHKFLIARSLRSLVSLVYITIAISSQLSPSFFDNLSDSEKVRLMNASLVSYLQEQAYTASPIRFSSLRQTSREIVPSQSDFQSSFIQWMLEDQKYNIQDIRDLVRGKPVCGARNCTTLPSLSQTCCPFG